VSAETKAALEAALRAHVADEQPDYPLLAAYYAICASVGSDVNKTGYLHARSESAAYELMGLVNIAKLNLDGDYLKDDD
jgi:hypothetical protein